MSRLEAWVSERWVDLRLFYRNEEGVVWETQPGKQ